MVALFASGALMSLDKLDQGRLRILTVADGTVVFTHCGSGSHSLAEKPSDITLAHVRLMSQGVCSLFPARPGPVTLVNLLPRFYDVAEGEILIDGVDVRKATLASLRGQIGLVTQETVLFNDTVRANIAYGMEDVDEARVESAARAAFAHDFILDLPRRYDTVIGERGSRLSGGQKQRIAIGRATLKDPPILILDEATSSLDAESMRLVQGALAIFMRGRTTLVIAHRLATVRDADRIVVLENGEVREEGRHDELLRQPGGPYSRLHDLQFSSEAQAL